MDGRNTTTCDGLGLPEAWRKFQQHAQLIFGGPLNSEEEEEQCSYLLLWVGDKGSDIFNSWDISAEDSKKLDSLNEHFKNHVQPKLNPVFARYKFNNEVQGKFRPYCHQA